MNNDVFRELVALYISLPREPSQAQIVAVREAFGRLLADYQPRTPEERTAIDDMADTLVAGLAEPALPLYGVGRT